MANKYLPLSSLLETVVDNRGRTCPTADAGIPLIATNCIHNDMLYPTYEKVRYVSKETYESWFRGHPKPGDLIFVLKGTPGRVCVAPDPVDFCIAQDMVALRADRQKVYPKYLFALLRSSEVQTKIEQMHVGTLIPHFKKGDFDRLLLAVPDQEIQRAAGDAYFDFSAKIELNTRMNKTLEGIARALFKSWFVDFDPVRAKVNGRDPELPAHLDEMFPRHLVRFGDTVVPEGWSKETLGDFALLNPESWANESPPLEIEYVDLSNTKWGRIESTKKYSWEEAPSRAQRVLRPGDTIVGTVRPGNGSYALINENGLTGSTGFAVLRPKRVELREIVYLAATSLENIERLAHLADGAAYPAVRPDVVVSTPVFRASDTLLDNFSRILRPFLDRIAVNVRESGKLTELRDSLLPKLLSGEIRIPQYIQSTMKDVVE